VEEPESQADVPRGIKIVEQDTNHNEAVANVLTQEDGTDTERKDVEINERNRDNAMVRICDGGNGSRASRRGSHAGPLEATSFRKRGDKEISSRKARNSAGFDSVTAECSR